MNPSQSTRLRGSKRLTRIKAKVIGTITRNVPKKRLLINPDNDDVIFLPCLF